MTTQELLSPQELEHLAEVRDVTVTASSAGWMRIVREMERFVAEAHEDMFGAVYASDAVKAALQRRWQQREAMLRGIKAYVNECESEKNTLVETLNAVPPEEPEPYGSHASEVAFEDIMHE